MATTKTSLTNAGYTLLGAGPMDLEAAPNAAGNIAPSYFHCGASLPAVGTEARHEVSKDKPYRYPGTANVYARAKDTDSSVVWTDHT